MKDKVLLLGLVVSLMGCPAPERPEGEDVPPSGAAEGGALPGEGLASAGRAAASASGDAALRCRCVQLPLADYYHNAAEVVAGRVVAVVEEYEEGEAGLDHLLVVEVVERPWKWDAGRPAALPGDTVRYRTASSSAGCGLGPSTGDGFLLFGLASPDEAPLPRVDTCSGSRRFGDGGVSTGFEDVPAERVHAQLDALSGLDVLARLAASDPDPEDPQNATLVGLVDLPPLTRGEAVALHEGPAPGSPVVARVGTYGELEAWEVEYEVAAAGVLARSGGWYKVRTGGGDEGWIAPRDVGTWFPYPEVVVARLNYLTEAWSGHVWPEPGAGIPTRSSMEEGGEPVEVPAEVLEVMDLAGTPWLRVRILDGSPCFTSEVNTTIEGWIPAWGEGGRPAAWYYSRGC